MAPITFSDDASSAQARIVSAIEAAGGTVTAQGNHTVDAVFRSSLFKFKDDVRFEIDATAKLIHFRSASRTGYSDLGANKKRMTELSNMLST